MRKLLATLTVFLLLAAPVATVAASTRSSSAAHAPRIDRPEAEAPRAQAVDAPESPDQGSPAP